MSCCKESSTSTAVHTHTHKGRECGGGEDVWELKYTYSDDTIDSILTAFPRSISCHESYDSFTNLDNTLVDNGQECKACSGLNADRKFEDVRELDCG